MGAGEMVEVGAAAPLTETGTDAGDAGALVEVVVGAATVVGTTVVAGAVVAVVAAPVGRVATRAALLAGVGALVVAGGREVVGTVTTGVGIDLTPLGASKISVSHVPSGVTTSPTPVRL